MAPSGGRARAGEMAETWMARPRGRGHHGPTMPRPLPARVVDPPPHESERRRAGPRRGRLSRANRLRALQAALRRIDSAWELSQSPLAQYRDLQDLGRTAFAQRAFPDGWAVQAVLRLACARVAGALEPRKGEFLERWVAGESIAGIAASGGLSRSHVSRRWRPQVLAAVDAEIANLCRALRAGERGVREALGVRPPPSGTTGTEIRTRNSGRPTRASAASATGGSGARIR